jgi:hypothetical protein
MSKMRVLLASAALAVAILPAASLAAPGQTDVTGTVTNNGHPVSGAKVTVICDNNAKKTTTDSNGVYLAVYKEAKCPAGSTVSVTATKGHKGGVKDGKANPVTTLLNVALINVALPELGIATGALALIGAAGAFMVTRRRGLRQS